MTWLWVRSLTVIMAASCMLPASDGRRGDLIDLPHDHPIFHPHQSLRPFAPIRRSERAFIADPLVWRVTLDKRQYQLGEVIWARVQVKNPSPNRTWLLNPPYIGASVATMGVWRSRLDPFIGGRWPSPVEVVSLNKTYRKYEFGSGPPRLKRYDGSTIILEPGATYDVEVPINVAQQIGHPERFGDHWWFAGIGFTEPGRYKVYLQYANLSELLPLEPAQEATATTEADSGPKMLPGNAFILGPVEFEIVEAETKQLNALQTLIRGWEQIALVRSDMIREPNPVDLGRVLERLGAADAAVKDTLVLTRLRMQFSLLREADADYRPRLFTLLDECRAERRRLLGNPMSAAYGLTECVLLEALGRRQEALEVARKLGTPDGAALLAKYKATKPTTSTTPADR